MNSCEIARQLRQIALQVNSKGQEVGQHQNLLGSPRHKLDNGIFEPGAHLKKSCFEEIPPALRRRFGRNTPNRVIGRRDARSMSEYDNASPHTYKMTRAASGSRESASDNSGAGT